MLRISRNQTGFTLIELLIVVAIIGILAAIAIPNLLTAMQRSKQKRSMADMRSAATAWEAYAVDNNAYTAAGAEGDFDLANYTALNYSSLSVLLSPTYIRSLPANDGWTRPFEWYVDAATGAQEYGIVSLGKDGASDSSTVYTPEQTVVFECDIVYTMGGFIRYPEGVQASASN